MTRAPSFETQLGLCRIATSSNTFAMASIGEVLLSSLKGGAQDALVDKSKDGGQKILAALRRSRRLRGDVMQQLFKLQDREEGGISDIVQLYHSSLGLNAVEQKANSCRCQQLLWKVAQRNDWSDEVLLFSEHVVAMAMDPNWNFLLQHIVTLCDARQLDLFCVQLTGHAVKLSRHRIGCRVLCRIAEQGKHSEAAFRLLSELASDISEHIEHRYSNFVVTKVLEHVEDFPGMDAALQTCAERSWGKTITLGVLAHAADIGKLKPCHCEALAARSDFEALKDLNKQGRVLYAAVRARLSMQTLQPPAESSVQVQTSGNLFLYSGVPVFYSWYTPEGVFVGYTFQGYLAYMPAATNFPVAQPPAPIEGPQCSERLTWSAAVRDVKHLLTGGPPTMHLGVVTFQGQQYSLDVTTCLEPSDKDASIVYFHAALKRIQNSSKPQVLMISFDIVDTPPVHHDFRHHVYVSSGMTLQKSDMLDVGSRFSMSIVMSIF